MTAVKFDEGKLRYDLVPPGPFEDLVRVLTFGANKYGDRNWENGLSWCRVFAACMRHLWAWFAKEETDPESGLPHLAHATCCLFFLMEYARKKAGADDRP